MDQDAALRDLGRGFAGLLGVLQGLADVAIGAPKAEGERTVEECVEILTAAVRLSHDDGKQIFTAGWQAALTQRGHGLREAWVHYLAQRRDARP